MKKSNKKAILIIFITIFALCAISFVIYVNTCVSKEIDLSLIKTGASSITKIYYFDYEDRQNRVGQAVEVKDEAGALADLITILGDNGVNVEYMYALTTHKQDVAYMIIRPNDQAKAIEALDKAGCFAIVLEKVPAALAAEVSRRVSCPTIGIGAGNGTDGQVLVYADMMGMSKGFKPKFLRQYADLWDVMTNAVGRYVDDVKSTAFPNEAESY